MPPIQHARVPDSDASQHLINAS